MIKASVGHLCGGVVSKKTAACGVLNNEILFAIKQSIKITDFFFNSPEATL